MDETITLSIQDNQNARRSTSLEPESEMARDEGILVVYVVSRLEMEAKVLAREVVLEWPDVMVIGGDDVVSVSGGC